jgi:hypothetical protein
MPKKNTIGAILLITGAFLSVSLYLVIWFNWPENIRVNIEIKLHDTFVVLSPIFIWLGIFSLSYNLFLAVKQLGKKFKYPSWNFTHLVMTLLLFSFIFYGREVIRFAFAFIGRRLDYPDGWTVYPPLSEGSEEIPYDSGFWENLSLKIPEISLIVLGLFVVFLSWKMIRNNKAKNL